MKLDPLSMLGSSHNRSTHRRSVRGKARTTSFDSFDILRDDDGDQANLLEGSESSSEEPSAPSMLRQPSGKDLMSTMMRESTSIFAAELDGMNDNATSGKFRRSKNKKHMSADDVLDSLSLGEEKKGRLFGGRRRSNKNSLNDKSEDELSVKSEHGTRSNSMFSQRKKKRGGRKSSKKEKSADELSTRSEHGTRSIPLFSPKTRGGMMHVDDKTEDELSTRSEHRTRSISLFSPKKRGGRRSSVTIGDRTGESQDESSRKRSMSLGYGQQSSALVSSIVCAADDDSSDVCSDFAKSDDEDVMPSLLTKKEKRKKKKTSRSKSKSDDESDHLGSSSSHSRRKKEKKHRSSHKSSKSKKDKENEKNDSTTPTSSTGEIIDPASVDADDENEHTSPKKKKKDKTKSKSKHKKTKSELDDVVKDVEGVQKVSKGDGDGGAFNKSFVQLDFCSTTED